MHQDFYWPMAKVGLGPVGMLGVLFSANTLISALGGVAYITDLEPNINLCQRVASPVGILAFYVLKSCRIKGAPTYRVHIANKWKPKYLSSMSVLLTTLL